MARSPRGSLRRRAAGEGGADRARTRRPRRGSGGARGTTHRARRRVGVRRAADATRRGDARGDARGRTAPPASRKSSARRANRLRPPSARWLWSRRERLAAEETLRAELASRTEGFAAEREAYHATRDEAAERERARHAEALARARAEARDLRAAAASAAERLRETTRDGADGKAALKQALALREAEAEAGRRSAGEAHRRLRAAEDTVARLEARTGEPARRRRPRSARSSARWRARRRRRARRRLRRRSRRRAPPR